MTREQALKLLADARYADDLQGNNDLQTAHNMAMEALRQKPCEDAISRQAVLDKLNRLIEVERLQGSDEMGYGRERVSAYECMIDEVESEYLYPSVTPKPKTGHWEYVQYDGNPNIGNWHCSECNRIVSGAISAVNPVYVYKFCPNCGAKMEEDL